MGRDNVILEKSYAFAVRVVRLQQFLVEHKREFVLSKQILRSGTSIGANVEEAIGAQSTNDFLAKISIAYKEARETRYWIRLLKDTNYLTLDQFNSLFYDIEAILKIISKIQSTTKNKQNN
ncbi:MAG TPA: four helix bundle protein [bacterium]|jgi:four helix bundle protein|nr:four helix bundle protein [bacterium]